MQPETTSEKSGTGAALAMLSAFASVGATAFDVTLLDLNGQQRGFQSNRSLEELRRSMAMRLEAARYAQLSFVIRPRSDTTTLIQLDDFDEAKAERMDPYSFLTVRTSPGNFQVWLAVTDVPNEKEAAKQFKTRVRRAAGGDHSATGATRIAGSLNFKTKYGPAFPLVTITHTAAALDQAGFIAPLEPPAPAASAPQSRAPSCRTRAWPDYQRALAGAPRKKDGNPDRSRADFMWCNGQLSGNGVSTKQR